MTHADIHAATHDYRARELRAEAATWRLAHGRPPAGPGGRAASRDRAGEGWAWLRDRCGWALVGLGLRLVSRPLSSSGPLYPPRGPGGTTPRPSTP